MYKDFWILEKVVIENRNTLMYKSSVNQYETISLFINSSEFRNVFSKILIDCPFKEYFLECKSVDNSTIKKFPFVFALIEDSGNYLSVNSKHPSFHSFKELVPLESTDI